MVKGTTLEISSWELSSIATAIYVATLRNGNIVVECNQVTDGYKLIVEPENIKIVNNKRYVFSIVKKNKKPQYFKTYAEAFAKKKTQYDSKDSKIEQTIVNDDTWKLIFKNE